MEIRRFGRTFLATVFYGISVRLMMLRLRIGFRAATALLLGLIPSALVSANPNGWIHLEPPDELRPLQAVGNLYVPANSERAEKKVSGRKDPTRRQLGPLNAAVRGEPTRGVYAREVEDLAKALNYDAAELFGYVLNEVSFQPYAGFRQGAAYTLRALRGNDYDQANLLIELLRASGYSADFVLGSMVLPIPTLADWFDVADHDDRVSHMLIVAAIPATREGNAYRTERLIVALQGDGGPIYLDPALVPRKPVAREDFSAFLDFDSERLIDLVTDGATVSRDAVSRLDEEALGEELDRMAENLALTLGGQYSDRTVEELFGDRPQQRIALPSDVDSVGYLSAGISVASTFAELEDDTKVWVTLGLGSYERDWFSGDLLDRRVSVSFPGNRPTLMVDGEVVTTQPVQGAGSQIRFRLQVDHPHWAFDGTYGDFDRERYFDVGPANFFVVPFGFDRIRDSPVRAQQAISEALAAGASHSDEAVVAGALHFVGQTYARNTSLTSRILGFVLGTKVTTEVNSGIVSSVDGSLVIDWIGYSTTNINREPNATDRDREIAFFVDGPILSAFEHGVVDQYLGEPDSALSTTKAIVLENRRGGTIHRVDGGNIAALEPLFRATYPDAAVDRFVALAEGGAWMLIPENGQITLGDWSGFGNFSLSETAHTYSILGGLNGGYAAVRKTVAELITEAAEANLPDPFAKMTSYVVALGEEYLPNVPPILSQDPVDMSTGFLTEQKTDLRMGGALPTGITLTRSYNSGLAGQPSEMGRGWTHNLAVSWSRKNLSFPLVGDRSVLDLAPALTYGYVVRELIDRYAVCTQAPCGGYTNDALAYTLAFLAGGWLSDQFIDSAIEIQRGHDVELYVRLPGGRFAPPPGLRRELVENADGSLLLTLEDNRVLELDAEGKLVAISDASGNRAVITHDGEGRLAGVTDAFGRSATVTYGDHGMARIDDSSGRSIRYTVDSDGLLTSVRETGGGLWRYQYDADGNLAEIENPRRIVAARNTFDDQRRVIEQDLVRQDGYATYRFGFSDVASWEEDPDGSRLVHRFDARGRGIASSDQMGYSTETVYNELDLAVEERDKAGNTTRTTYDSQLNPVSRTDAAGYVEEAIYDPEHNLVRVTDPLGRVTRFEWDERSLNTAMVTPMDHRSVTAYGSRGEVLSFVDANGISVTYTTDEYGFRDSSTIAGKDPVVLQHDARGNLTDITNRQGATATFTFDEGDRMTRRVGFAGGEETQAYDARGNLIRKTRRDGTVLEFTWTPTDQVDRISLPDGTVYEHTYDIHDRLVEVSGPEGTTRFVHNARHEVVEKTDSFGLTTRYAYEPNGKVARITYPDGFFVDYRYDPRGLLTTVRDAFGNVTSYSYDGARQLLELQHANGVREVSGYDEDGRRIAVEVWIDGEPALSQTAAFDGVGNLAAMNAAGLPDFGLEEFDGVSATYDPGTNRIASAGLDDSTVDTHGRVAQIGSVSYQFDARDRLIGMTGPVVLTNTFDYANRRIARSLDGETVRFGYDENGRLLYEADESGNLIQLYVHGNGPLYTLDATGSTSTVHFGLTFNAVARTGEEGEVLGLASYSPFGRRGLSAGEDIGALAFHGMAGAYSDTPDLVLMGARYFDVHTGRFLSEDPIGFADDINLYRFVGNNPLTRMDPTGTVAVQVSVADVVSYGFEQLGVESAVSTAVGGVVTGLLGPIGIIPSFIISPIVDDLTDSIVGAAQDWITSGLESVFGSTPREIRIDRPRIFTGNGGGSR